MCRDFSAFAVYSPLRLDLKQRTKHWILWSLALHGPILRIMSQISCYLIIQRQQQKLQWTRYIKWHFLQSRCCCKQRNQNQSMRDDKLIDWVWAALHRDKETSFLYISRLSENKSSNRIRFILCSVLAEFSAIWLPTEAPLFSWSSVAQRKSIWLDKKRMEPRGN